MGPRLFSRGNGQHRGRSGVRASASMGPRLFSRGNVRRPDCIRLERVASMGPRLFSRGNIAVQRRVRPQEPALQWGRGSSAAEMRPTPAIRQTPPVLQWGRGSSAAEIQFHAEEYDSTQVPLQWGRGSSAAEMSTWRVSWARRRRFNGAAALQPRKSRQMRVLEACERVASMGPRLFSRGNNALAGWQRDRGIASMGPRLFSRGNRLPPWRSSMDDAQASMGPRLFSRGNWSHDAKACSLDGELQWGRGSSAAEISSSASGEQGARTPASMGPRLFSRGNAAVREASDKGSAALQWGRGSSAAEITLSLWMVNSLHFSFNGAAALQPRKSGVRWPRQPRPKQLQWGRGSSAAEMRSEAKPRRRAGVASMGPRLFSRGNSRRGWIASALNKQASMGPRLFSRGNNERRRSTSPPQEIASMGPRLFSRGNQVSTRSVCRKSQGFNGAAALQPRKSGSARSPGSTSQSLQWGRGSSAAEM